MIIKNTVALICGIVFSLGLIMGGMLNPANVLAFLDISANWSPALAFVLCGAVLVTFFGVRLQKQLAHPVFDTAFQLPTARRIDRPLITGSCLFGLGWGLVGLCPGPAIASLFIGQWQSLVFLLGLFAGMKAFSYWKTPV